MAKRKELSVAKARPRKLRGFSRGDKVRYWYFDESKADKAVFVQYDEWCHPPVDAILAIKIGKFVQTFRWPLKLMAPLT